MPSVLLIWFNIFIYTVNSVFSGPLNFVTQ